MKTIKDFKNTVKIYKSHKLKNGFISITYAVKLGSNACTNEKTIEVENKGGALHSLYAYYCEGI